MAYKRKVRLTKFKLRSAITRGKHVLQDVDHRSPEMRRLADLLDAHVRDLGGPDNISHAERIITGRFSMLALLAEMKEADFARHNMKITDAQLSSYGRLVNTMVRTGERLGLARRPRDVTPTMQEYLAQKAAEKEEQDATAE